MSFITKMYKNFFEKNKSSETVIDIRPKTKMNNGNIILLVHPDGKEEQIHAYKNLDVRFIGKNSLLKIYSSVKIRSKLTCTLGEGGIVILNENVTIGNVKFSMFGENSTIHIGKNTTIHNATFYCDNEPNSKIYVGEECLFSIEIVIRACDGHTIYEKGNPSHILNKPKSGIFIGNHVWIGQRAFILKDSYIPDNSIVAAMALIANAFQEQNILLGGMPAKILKHNVCWDRKKISAFEQQNKTFQ